MDPESFANDMVEGFQQMVLDNLPEDGMERDETGDGTGMLAPEYRVPLAAALRRLADVFEGV